MTDKELIKALRCCTSRPDCDKCAEECVFYRGNNVEGCVPDMGVTVSNRMEALLAENEHLREVTKMVPKWVSVSERLPESDEQVLVTFTGNIGKKEYIGGYLLAEYVPGDGWILEEYPQLENPNVTHWCELPEPPSTEGGGGNEQMQKVLRKGPHVCGRQCM